MPKNFFSVADQNRIIESIRLAELATSGEIRVHIEEHCPGDPIERAKEMFFSLNMNETEQQNGVLIYLALLDKKFAILGDKGIHALVHDSFWQSEKDLMKSYFVKSDYTEGLVQAIEKVGEKLKVNFPYQKDDTNELSNDISFGGKPDA
jgi:uncharacterized membrane protein